MGRRGRGSRGEILAQQRLVKGCGEEWLEGGEEWLGWGGEEIADDRDAALLIRGSWVLHCVARE